MAKNPRQIGRFAQVVVQRRIKGPAQTVVDDKARPQVPGVLKEQMIQQGNSRPSEASLGHKRISDSDGKVLERQLQNLLQGQEAGRQGNLEAGSFYRVETPDVDRRKESHGERLVIQA